MPSCENLQNVPMTIKIAATDSRSSVKNPPIYLHDLHQSPRQESRVVPKIVALRINIIWKNSLNCFETFTYPLPSTSLGHICIGVTLFLTAQQSGFPSSGLAITKYVYRRVYVTANMRLQHARIPGVFPGFYSLLLFILIL